MTATAVVPTGINARVTDNALGRLVGIAVHRGRIRNGELVEVEVLPVIAKCHGLQVRVTMVLDGRVPAWQRPDDPRGSSTKPVAGPRREWHRALRAVSCARTRECTTAENQVRRHVTRRRDHACARLAGGAVGRSLDADLHGRAPDRLAAVATRAISPRAARGGARLRPG